MRKVKRSGHAESDEKIGQHAAHRLGGTVEVTVLVFSNRFGVLGETQCQET